MVITTYRKNLLDMVKKTPLKCSSSIQHAWIHIDKANDLLGIDNEMAAFRAITAEEEAVTGLFKAYKFIGYNNSEKLKHRNHRYKAGFWYLILSINNFVASLKENKHLLDLSIGFESEKLILKFPSPIKDDSKKYIPIPPLNFSITNFNDEKNYDFSNQIHEIELKNGTNISKFIENEANLRNKILYAADEGYPIIAEIPKALIKEREKRVAILTCIYLIIIQSKEKQLFAQQCLNSFFKMLGVKITS